MTMPTGTLSFSQLQTEFGGSNPISLSEYYRGGARVNSGTTSAYGTIPTSGAITLGVFRGTVSWYYSNIASTTAGGRLGPAQIRSYTDGTIELVGNESGNTTRSWYTPTTAGIGATHWIRVTKTSGSGTTTGGTLGTWLQMNVGYTWSMTASSNQVRNWFGTVEIASASGGSPIVSTSGTGNIGLISDWTPL